MDLDVPSKNSTLHIEEIHDLYSSIIKSNGISRGINKEPLQSLLMLRPKVGNCLCKHVYMNSLLDRPPLWSSGQNSWLQVQKSGFDSWRYQIF
jgi:hypothetical protein